MNGVTFSRTQVFANAPFRPRGYVKAVVRSAVHLDAICVRIPREALEAIRKSFPPLTKPRGYGPAESRSDALLWPENAAPEVKLAPTPSARLEPKHWGPPMWAESHTFPLTFSPEKEHLRLRRFKNSIPCGECKTKWKALEAKHQPNLSSPEAYARWLHARHNDVREDCGQRPFFWPETVAKYRYPSEWATEELLLTSWYCPGDITVVSGLVWDLHDQYPGRYRIAVRSMFQEIFENNPLVVSQDTLINPRDLPITPAGDGTFYRMWMNDLEAKLGTTLRSKRMQGDVYLSEAEMNWPDELLPDREPYWLLAAGYKTSYETKYYPNWQDVVGGLSGQKRLVRVGHTPDYEHRQPDISGTLDLIGRTSLRDLVRLVYHSDGVLCHESLPMHLAAAVPVRPGAKRPRPCVVVVGGRSPAGHFAYEGQTVLHADMDCNPGGGCWKSHVRLRPGMEAMLCKRPREGASECMRQIPPEAIVEAVLAYGP